MEAKEKIAPFRPKKSLNMVQLFENLNIDMQQHLGSQPGDVIPVGFRIYSLDLHKEVLTSQGFFSKGIKLENFGNEDQAVEGVYPPRYLFEQNIYISSLLIRLYDKKSAGGTAWLIN